MQRNPVDVEMCSRTTAPHTCVYHYANLVLKCCSKLIPKIMTLLLCLQEGFAPPEEGGNDVNEFGYEDEQDEY